MGLGGLGCIWKYVDTKNYKKNYIWACDKIMKASIINCAHLYYKTYEK